MNTWVVLVWIFLVFGAGPSEAAVAPEDAERMINRIIDIFRPEIEKIHQLPVKVYFSWNNDVRQALGGRVEDAVEFRFFGGLLATSKDGLALIVCHELGHALGGLPIRGADYPFPMSTVEGQADYFSTSKCSRILFKNEEFLSGSFETTSTTLSEHISTPCRQVYWDSDEDAKICQRSLLAARDAFRLMYTSTSLDFDGNDTSVAPATILEYPSRQCRLDTVRSGALCRKSSAEPFSFENPTQGACNDGDGLEYAIGARPKCWYRAN